MFELIIVFILCVLYKLIINLYKGYRCKVLYQKYIEWLSSKGSYSIEETSAEVKDLLKDYKDIIIPVVEPAGLGIVNTMKISVLGQYPSIRADFATAQMDIFNKAISQYYYSAHQSVNPIYWIELIVWLPKNLVSFLGINTELASVKAIYIFLQIVYWLYGLMNMLGLDIKPFFLQIFAN